MDLDRGLLARIDRRVLSRLGDEERYRMVRLPVSEAIWSTWKRYCDAAGISMGRAIVALVRQELGTVVAETGVEDPRFGQRAAEQLAERQTDLDLRKRGLDARAEQLRVKERQLRILDQQIRSAPAALSSPRESSRKVGRNERCPCGSGFKYKQCHGLAGRIT
jgi:hypothetical protein